MSLAAARAMRDLSECLDEAAEDMPAGQGFAVMKALAVAHRKAAERIEAWSAPAAPPPARKGSKS